MTYQVLIVDDEPMIRFGLASAVQWEQEGLRLAGEAANGKAALELMDRQPVDILVTDIKMPVMDGIELTREAKRRNPAIKVIFVSSYTEFEYAREAVKLGVVVDYLLKPTMEPEDLAAALRLCKEELDAQRSAAGAGDEPAPEPDADTQWKRLLHGEAVQAGELPGWPGGAVSVMVWQPEMPGEGDGLDRLLLMARLREELARRLERGVALITGERELVAVVPDGAGHPPAAPEHLHRRMQNELGRVFTVGVSPPVHRLQAVPDAYRWAREALESAFFTGTGRCYYARVGGRPARPPEIRERDAQAWVALRDRFSRAFAYADRDVCCRTLQEVCQLWRGETFPKSEVLRQAQSLLTIMHARSGLMTTEEMMVRTSDKMRELAALSTLPELCAALEREFDDCWKMGTPRLVPEDAARSHAIQLALSHIRQKYREDLSLQEVADYVHMSKNYFSEQFKKHTGLNFIDFVIRLRIQYAKHLLATTGLKIYEVAAQSGFNSTKHFMKMFKREVGLTPAEYRERHRQT